MLCLLYSILTGSAVQYQKSFPVSIRIFLINNSVDLFKLFHKIFLIVQSSGSIADKQIYISCLCRTAGIVYNRCRIGTLLLCNYIHSCPVCPLLKLLYSTGSECIGCCNKHPSSGLLKLTCQFTYRSSFSYSVYSDYKKYGFSVFKFIGTCTKLHALPYAAYKYFLTFRRVFDMQILYLGFYFLYYVT